MIRTNKLMLLAVAIPVVAHSAEDICEPNEDGMFSRDCLRWTVGDGYKRGYRAGCSDAGGRLAQARCQPAAQMAPGNFGFFAGGTGTTSPVPLVAQGPSGVVGGSQRVVWENWLRGLNERLDAEYDSEVNYKVVTHGDPNEKGSLSIDLDGACEAESLDTEVLLDALRASAPVAIDIKNMQPFTAGTGTKGIFLEFEKSGMSQNRIQLGTGQNLREGSGGR